MLSECLELVVKMELTFGGQGKNCVFSQRNIELTNVSSS